MAEQKKPAAKTAKAAPELLFEDGYWWIVSGTKRLNVGRSQRHAQRLFADQTK